MQPKHCKPLHPSPKKPEPKPKKEILEHIDGVYQEMDDDFNTPRALARLFELATKINSLKGGQISLADVSASTLDKLKQLFASFLPEVLGLLNEDETGTGKDGQIVDGLMDLILQIRQQARQNKDWSTSDQIRDALTGVGIQVKDGKEGVSWSK